VFGCIPRTLAWQIELCRESTQSTHSQPRFRKEVYTADASRGLATNVFMGIPEREPVAWSKSPNPARNHPLVAHILTTRGGSERAANDLRQAVRTGLGNGNYTLLFLWIKFWSYGGDARMTELGAFIRGSQELSNIDAIVLGFVVDELHEPWRKAIRTLHRRATGSSRPPPQRPQRR